MRVNVYAEEMTERIEIVSKTIDEVTFTGLRFYLELPVSVPVQHPADGSHTGKFNQISGPFMHHPGDDDSAAITFWGKRDLRDLLDIAKNQLDIHYGEPQEPR